MRVGRTLFVVATLEAYWPPEAWAVFGTQAAAEEYVEAAAWEFRVEPLPVYGTYEQCPMTERSLLGGPESELMFRSLRRLEAAGIIGRLRDDFPPGEWDEPPEWGAESTTVYAVCGHETDGERFDDSNSYIEVQLFYETQAAAAEHISNTWHMFGAMAIPVYGTYGECPLTLRFATTRPALPSSQCMRRKTR
jgi:hypothetical protein